MNNKFFEIVRAEEDRLIANGKIDTSTKNGRITGIGQSIINAMMEIVEGHRDMEDFKYYWDNNPDFVVLTKRGYRVDNIVVKQLIEFCDYFEFNPFD